VAATYLAMLEQLSEDLPSARASAEDALLITTEARAPYYRAWSMILVDHARAMAEPGEASLVRLRGSIAGFKASGARLRLPYFLGLLAQASSAAGKSAEGLSALDEAMAEARSSHERVWDAELHRLRGILRFESGAPRQEAEAALLRALEIAAGMGARGLERRAADSLARLRAHPG
jgi:predicted ATPase